ncbi:MAG TPA: glycosyltransferase N-terminal domain-containing protein [Gemmatimonadales bacterium]|nr:glycosyltransferase N-terminal domain-containing protein [Gemmatimonadales bacterium]HRX17618.1 glycosyltransferase N-terminal domain-containing protein [Gemmatimonadales bacterium]
MADPRPLAGYRLLARLAVPLAGRLLRGAAARRGHQGRLAAPADLAAWARTARDPSRPLVWLHAASVGEGLQAAAVAEALRTSRPDIQLLMTRFSASAERIAGRLPADHVGYLPYDRLTDVTATLDAVRPDAVVFTKVDVWPELATAAARRGSRVGLVAGTVDPGSSRLRWPARAFSAPGYRAIAAAGAVSQDSAERLVQLGVAPGRITVTGDPRVDSALAIVERADAGPRDDRLLVAGSTWREDELVLLEAFAQVRTRHPEARLMLVPHEPDEQAVASIAARAASLALPTPVTWPRTGPLVVVRAMGVLAARYLEGGLAWVGGGFGTRGVHSLLEPAAAAAPIAIGPHDRGGRDAALLASAGALTRLPADAATAALVHWWSEALEDPQAMRERGARARAALAPDREAARRSAELVVGLL